MAIMQMSFQVISRGNGDSAVSSAAYRAATRLYDERLGEVFDYSRKLGVEHTEIIIPPGAPEWMHDREKLWNAVERTEKRKDAQLAREFWVALPRELTNEEQLKVLREFVTSKFVSLGMVADVSVHMENPRNPHAHIMLTTRVISGGEFGLKNRDWNTKRQLYTWRQAWAKAIGLEEKEPESRRLSESNFATVW